MSRLPLSLIVFVLTGWACGGGPSSEQPPSGNPSQGTPKEIAPAADGAWYRKAVFYEVFVRSFQDSDGDGKGDLKGLISRLDYLNDGDPNTTQDLGVDALWLMPVFASPSYHGYDVVDYERINPDYGTEEDFEQLCAEAHRRGMRVILDFVINHTGADHPWFVESASSLTSPKRDWYVWKEQDPGWRQPWDLFSNTPTWYPRNGAYYYGVFWGGMPDLNVRNAEVRAELKRLASLWLARGADGFRLDAARYLIETGSGGGQADTPETHAFWKEFSAHVRQVKPDAVLVGENWSTTPVIASYYGSTKEVPGGDELALNFDFPLSEQILAGIKAGNAVPIASKLVDLANSYPAGTSDAPFLTNHDMVRVGSQLSGDGSKLANAAALLLTLPGAPFLYYGVGWLRGRWLHHGHTVVRPLAGVRDGAQRGRAAGRLRLAALALPRADPCTPRLGGAEPGRPEAPHLHQGSLRHARLRAHAGRGAGAGGAQHLGLHRERGPVHRGGDHARDALRRRQCRHAREDHERVAGESASANHGHLAHQAVTPCLMLRRLERRAPHRESPHPARTPKVRQPPEPPGPRAPPPARAARSVRAPALG
jgi:alpha-amylase